jgi:hypothetical protein
MSSFEIDSKISISLEYDLAVRLGEFIVSKGTEDKQLAALGYNLFNMDNGEDDIPNRKNWNKYPQQQAYKQHKEIIRSAGKILEKQEENYWDDKEFSSDPPIKINKSYKNNM